MILIGQKNEKNLPIYEGILFVWQI